MKTLLLLSITTAMALSGSIYDFKVKGLEGNEIDFNAYKGKYILIVNTASECGFTPQYEDLETLYKKYSDKLVIVGFPANNFGGQEPGSNEEIKDFCKRNYGVTFPMAEKVSVKGDDIHPLFSYLTEEAKKINADEPIIRWNFTKFLINKEGKLVKVFPSKVKPTDEQITSLLN